MSLKHAILVLLETEPASGYDLYKQFKQSLGYFWNASHQQVYQQLKRMTEDGWLKYSAESQSDKPDRKVYRMTDKGRKALISWISTPVKPNKINDALLVKLYGGDQVPPEALIEELERHTAIHRHTLDKLLAIQSQYEHLPDDQRPAWELPFLTLRRGILGEEAWLVWAAETHQALERRQDSVRSPQKADRQSG